MSRSGSGLFVSVEGGDGSGKTTHAALLASALRDEGLAVTEVRDPGTTDIGLRIRELLLRVSSEQPPVPWAEAALFLAARVQLLQEVIQPRLAAGQLVLADRYLDSSLAYQGSARGLTQQAVLELHRVAGADLLPDLTLLLDLEVEEARRRRESGSAPDRLEFESTAYHEGVRDGYLEVAERFPERVVVLQAEQSPGDLVRESLNQVHQAIQRRRSA